jgi:predicted Zn-dependent protease
MTPRSTTGWKVRLGCALVIGLAAAGCASTTLPPATRSPSGLALEEDERRIWNRAGEEQEKLRRAHVEYDDPALKGYVNAVAQRVAPAEVAQAGIALDVRVIKNPALNAFMYPNGTMYVHTGILARMENEAQLATLLAHEMTHATHRHAVRQFRDMRNKADFMAGLSVATLPFGSLGLLANLLGSLGMVAAVYGYSQDLEREADAEGFQLMVRAGYDPREAPKLFRHLKQWVEDEDKPEPFFFNTHPRLAERIASYEDLIARNPQFLSRPEPLRIGEEAFLAHTRRMIFDDALLDLSAGRFLQAQKGFQKVLGLDPENARANFFMAETYRSQNDPKLFAEATWLYQRAIALDPTYADPHKGLGTLHYQARQSAEAAAEFQQYLQLAPVAADRGHIQSLIESLQKEVQK